MVTGDGTRTNGTSSLDKPTGTRKYNMSAPDASEQAAGINRQDQARSDRMLSRLVRDPKASPSARIEAAQEQQKRRDTPGYVNGRGIGNVEQSRNQDRLTADKKVQAGLVAEETRKKQIATLGGQQSGPDAIEGSANKFPSSSQVPPPGGGVAPVVAPSPPAGQVATPPVTTPPAPSPAANSGTSAVPDWQQKRSPALKTIKFGNDITSWATSEDKDGKPTREKINEYGETLGISSDQIEAQVEKARNQSSQKAANKALLPAGKGALGGDYRTDAQFAEDMRSGTNGERSVITDKEKAWMRDLESAADKPKDRVTLFEAAYNKYQKGIGSENGAYNKADFEEMQKIREKATPAELRVIDRISSGKGSTLSATETQHTEGNYRGSNKNALETYQSLLNSPQYTEADLDGKKRTNSINYLYGQMNSLDQAKVIGMTLKQSNDFLEPQKVQGLVDGNGKAEPKLLEIERNTTKDTTPSSKVSSVGNITPTPQKKEDAVKPPVTAESLKSTYPEIDTRKALEESNSLRSADLGGQVADGIEQEVAKNKIEHASDWKSAGDSSVLKIDDKEFLKKPSPAKASLAKDASTKSKDLDWNAEFESMSPSDPRYKALQIKNSSYAKAWILTPGSLIPALRQDLNKSLQDQINERARSRMISDAIEKGVDISGITKQDPSFHKQYEDAKEQKSKSPDQASIDTKSQQREAAYRAPINDVLERSSFLQKYALG